MNARGAAALACSLAFGACTGPEPVVDRFPALGTLVTVTVHEPRADSTAAALRAVRAAFERAGHDWRGWGDGDLARYNDARAAGHEPAVPASVASLLARADALAARSGGLFDPHLGALVEAWGFHDGERAPGPPPTADAIAAALADDRIDLGAIAKGAAVADAVATLRDAGIAHALVDAGGDLAALGDAGGRPWRIGVRDPRGTGAVAALSLAGGEAVFTSGDYERYFVWDGARHHHLLDPRTGRPAGASASVTVVDRDPVLADAAVTALFVAGDDWPRVAHALGVAEVMRVLPDGRIEASRALAERAEFLGDAPVRIVELDVAAR